jgi:hypothetical protein
MATLLPNLKELGQLCIGRVSRFSLNPGLRKRRSHGGPIQAMRNGYAARCLYTGIVLVGALLSRLITFSPARRCVGLVLKRGRLMSFIVKGRTKTGSQVQVFALSVSHALEAAEILMQQDVIDVAVADETGVERTFAEFRRFNAQVLSSHRADLLRPDSIMCS